MLKSESEIGLVLEAVSCWAAVWPWFALVVLLTKNQACFFLPASFPHLSTPHSGKCLLQLPEEGDNSPTINIDLSLDSILLVKSCFYSDNPELISNLKRLHCWILTEGIIFNHSVYWFYKSSYWKCLYTVISPSAPKSRSRWPSIANCGQDFSYSKEEILSHFTESLFMP